MPSAPHEVPASINNATITLFTIDTTKNLCVLPHVTITTPLLADAGRIAARTPKRRRKGTDPSHASPSATETI
jgi:hypothetical protein